MSKRKKLRATITPKCKCPVCFYETDRMSCITDDNKIPEPGDLNICIRCGNFCIILEDLTYRQATADELNRYRQENPDIFYKAMMASQYIGLRNQRQ